MAICHYIADSAHLPPTRILREERPALILATHVRVMGSGSLPSSATGFAIAA